MLLQRPPLELEGRGDEPRVRGPQLGAETDRPGDLKLLQPHELGVQGELPQHGPHHVPVSDQPRELHIGPPQPGRQSLQLGPVRADQGHHVGLGGVSVDADVLHKRTGLQDRLHLAKADVLSELELDQILLPVNDPDAAVVLHLADIPGPEPPPARGVSEILLGSLLLVLEVAGRHIVPADQDLPPGPGPVGDPVVALLPVLEPDVDPLDRGPHPPCAVLVHLHQGGARRGLRQPVALNRKIMKNGFHSNWGN